jgi:hypothetical protein
MCPENAIEKSFPLVPFESPFQPDAVDSPLVVYPPQSAPWLTYPHRDGDHFVRASFDRWDALRVCRGEYPPSAISGGRSSLRFIENSRWLRERYEYEWEHYGRNKQYAFGRNVDEMLEEFDHHVFLFHDEFVEVIAGGVSFETATTPFGLETPLVRLGLDELPETQTLERYEEHGLVVQIRRDPRPIADLVAASSLCDQSLFQVALELDGAARVSHRLTVRTRRGRTLSRWRSFFGRVDASFDGVVDDVATLRPMIARYADEVAERRRQRRAR